MQNLPTYYRTCQCRPLWRQYSVHFNRIIDQRIAQSFSVGLNPLQRNDRITRSLLANIITFTMRVSIVSAILMLAASSLALDKPLDIQVTQEATCDRKSQKGDKIEVHYKGTLESDGAPDLSSHPAFCSVATSSIDLLSPHADLQYL